MIALYPEKLSSVSASSEDSAFPATNLEDTKIKKVWKSNGLTSATLTATVAADANGLALFGTNAISATITVLIGPATQEVQSFDLTPASGRTYNRLWMSYTAIGVVHTIEIALTTAVGQVIEAGVLKVGIRETFKNPSYGLGESRKDFSIVKELNNGAFYIRKKHNIRIFNVSFITIRETEFFAFSDLYDYYGPEAITWLLVENINDYQWSILGHMTDPFSGNHSYVNNSDISFSITEAV